MTRVAQPQRVMTGEGTLYVRLRAGFRFHMNGNNTRAGCEYCPDRMPLAAYCIGKSVLLPVCRLGSLLATNEKRVTASKKDGF